MGNYQLAALHVQPPQQQENPVEQYVKLKSLLGQQQLQQQAIQEGQIGLQQKQQDIKDQQALNAAMQQWDGKDPQALISLGQKNGASFKAINGIKSQIVAQQEKYSQIAKDDAETGSKNLDTAIKKNHLIIGALNSALDAPDDQLPNAITQTAQALIQQGVLDPQHGQIAQKLAMLPPAQARQSIQALQKSMMSDLDQQNKAKEEADLAAKKAQLPGQQAESQIKVQDAAMSPMERALKGQNALEYYAAKGDPLANQALQKKIQVAQASRPVNVTQSNLLSDDAVDMAAQYYRKTGTLPSGFSRSPQSTAAVIQRATEQAKAEGGDAGDIAQNKLNYKTYQQQAAKAQPQFVAIDTANQHLDLAGKAAQALQNGDVQLINKIANAYGVQVGKDPTTTFNAIMTVAGPEIVKASANTGQMSEREIEKARSNFSTNMSPSQIASNVAAMRQLMSGKKAALQKNLQGLKSGNVTGGDVNQPQSQGNDWFSQHGGKAVK